MLEFGIRAQGFFRLIAPVDFLMKQVAAHTRFLSHRSIVHMISITLQLEEKMKSKYYVRLTHNSTMQIANYTRGDEKSIQYLLKLKAIFSHLQRSISQRWFGKNVKTIQ